MEDVGVIILAGGKSSRMGEDKGLMSLFGKSMVSYVIDLAENLANEIIIVSDNSNYKQFGHQVVKDIYKEKGPLGGIFAGLSASENETNFVLSCDIPYMQVSLLKLLYESSAGYDVTIPQKDDRVHPLIGVYRKSCLERFQECLEKDQLKVLKAFASLNFNIVMANDFDEFIFKNLNSKSDISPF